MQFSFYNHILYYNNCDLSYKYLIKSVKKIPKIKTLNLKFISTKSLNVFEGILSEVLLLKYIFCLYFIFQRIPYISCVKNLLITTKEINNYSYNLKLKIHRKDIQCYNLLVFIFRDIIADAKSGEAFKYNSDKMSNCLNNFNFFFKLNKYLEYNNVFSTIFNDKALYSFNVGINIIFQNIKKVFLSNNELKTFFMF